MTLSERLVSLRESKGLTQVDVSEKLGIKRARYNAWEQGLSQPNIEMLKSIAELYNISTDYLVGKSDMVNAEIERMSLDSDIRVIQRAALEMTPEQREKAIEMWDVLFKDVISNAKKQEGVNNFDKNREED
ncbi:helix-turn-helix domain-containing protein [Lysinibacillus capsici]|uniref:helix-turn-helix domain-containing protein n=1 Tax=Lysinibacillus capsici TaxID=2115968 RepID=UPI000E20BE06|nr:helix-turn-helix domain-containing protein [Lysinibacillus capsici]RDV25863.1 transcriptional regulator [Lysinibacillus capsici]